MTEAPEKTDKLLKYRRPGEEAPAPAKPIKGKRPYEAYSLTKDVMRHLELRPPFPDPSENPLNSMITNIRGEWRRGLMLTIVYGKSMMVEIEGRNLLELIPAVKAWKVDWLEEFDQRFHLPVTDTAAPIIEKITITTPKMEEPPPMEKRH